MVNIVTMTISNLLQQGMIGGWLLTHGFNAELFVGIVVVGMFSMIGLFIYYDKKRWT